MCLSIKTSTSAGLPTLQRRAERFWTRNTFITWCRLLPVLQNWYKLIFMCHLCHVQQMWATQVWCFGKTKYLHVYADGSNFLFSFVNNVLKSETCCHITYCFMKLVLKHFVKLTIGLLFKCLLLFYYTYIESNISCHII